jgi:hypothetical protein
MRKSKVILLVLVLFGSSCVAQPFINEINQFRKAPHSLIGKMYKNIFRVELF